MALAWAFAKCGMFSRKSGGMGGYAEYAFGKSGNFMANYTYGVSLLIANVAIAISAVGYGTELFGATLSPVQIGSGDHRRAVAVHRRQLRRRAHYRANQQYHRLGRDYSGCRSVHHRLVLV
ncbi:putrescine transporter [Citrobacter koseri]|nr:putrescine transporter [Citrobacter koseri]